MDVLTKNTNLVVNGFTTTDTEPTPNNNQIVMSLPEFYDLIKNSVKDLSEIEDLVKIFYYNINLDSYIEFSLVDILIEKFKTLNREYLKAKVSNENDLWKLIGIDTAFLMLYQNLISLHKNQIVIDSVLKLFEYDKDMGCLITFDFYLIKKSKNYYETKILITLKN
jgi:hypothetical protein